MRYTSSACDAMYWLVQPCKSVNLRCSLFSETPHPTNLISYKYESGILLGKFVEFFFDGFQWGGNVRIKLHKEVSAPKSYTIYHYDSARYIVTAQFFFFFYIYPFRTAVLLMAFYPFSEFFVPYPASGQLNRWRSKFMRFIFRERTFTGSLSSCD